jgi:methylated-DNA-[protein]-cysteine S-methyltransferase
MPWTTYDSPIGRLALQSGDRGLAHLFFPGRTPDLDPAERDDGAPALTAAVAALDRYFAGDGAALTELEVELGGTPFQRAVWQRLREIPAGETTTYAAIARELGRPAAVRAVGAAVGRTPVPVVVPCHRVVGSDGSLTGYYGGLERKAVLLALEGARPAPLPAA